jgi:hypothetical protein
LTMTPSASGAVLTGPSGITGDTIPTKEQRLIVLCLPAHHPVSDDPLGQTKARLHNWARWSRHDCLPDLHAKLSSLWSQWIPRQGWDAGWGDLGAPEEGSKGIDDSDAELIDHHIVWLTLVHRTTIKSHYIDHDRQPREHLDEACRALEDLMR